MAAPSGTVWGEIKGGYSAYPTSYGRLGIYVGLSNSNTQTTATVQIWFWSKYGVDDSYNELFYTNAASASSASGSLGSKHIKTSVSSGSGWSESNQVKVYETSHTYTRGTAATKRYLYAKLSGMDAVGATIYASTTINVPALASYSIQYNANGGSGAPSAQTKFYGKNITLSSTKPTRTGYSFQGWATSASGSVAYAAGANYTANAAVTLYAVWKANTYAVTYNANGGSLGNVSNQTKTYGVTLKLDSDKPTRANYNFVGWATSAGSNTVAYAAGANYTQNAAITLYAIWELAYTKPRITNISLTRCDASGVAKDDGTRARLKFDWACDYGVTSICVFCVVDGAQCSWDLTDSGKTSGSADLVMGDEASILFVSDKTFTFEIVITDSEGDNLERAVLNGIQFPFDAIQTEEGTGAAAGKPAELVGVFDIGYKTKFTGGITNIVAEKVSDLDELNVPNIYVSVNKGTETYANAPEGLTGTFTIEVMSAGAEGQLLQRLTSCSKTDPNVYTRIYYQGSWGKWIRQFEVSLYNSTSGSTGEITLAESVENFEYIEVFYTDNNNKVGGSVKVYNPQGKTLSLSVIEAGSTVTTYFRRTSYTVSGTTITPDIENAGYVRISTATPSHFAGTNYIKIYRVVGFERGFM